MQKSAGQVADGRLIGNIAIFARLLRGAGLRVGPDMTRNAVNAVVATGLSDPRVLYWTLHAAFVNRPADRDIFAQAFHLFWRDPGYVNQLLFQMSPKSAATAGSPQDAMARRLAESLLRGANPSAKPRDVFAIDARGSASDLEVLAAKDFEQMTAAELQTVQAAIRQLQLVLAPLQTRRFHPAARLAPRRFDLRRTLGRSRKTGFETITPLFKAPRRRAPPLVILCDVSGSMDVYARVFLHFLYGAASRKPAAHAFLFGTRLTNITRLLSGRDPDAAIGKVSRAVMDWSGGTRIGESLETFNRLWGRRVLGQNATVLLFTDGLDRQDASRLDASARRLRASCRRLIWLNPLLRYDRYAPAAAGAAALAKHASAIKPCHSIISLAEIVHALGDRHGGLKDP
jgi:hypothetical protein